MPIHHCVLYFYISYTGSKKLARLLFGRSNIWLRSSLTILLPAMPFLSHDSSMFSVAAVRRFFNSNSLDRSSTERSSFTDLNGGGGNKEEEELLSELVSSAPEFPFLGFELFTAMDFSLLRNRTRRTNTFIKEGTVHKNTMGRGGCSFISALIWSGLCFFLTRLIRVVS